VSSVVATSRSERALAQLDLVTAVAQSIFNRTPPPRAFMRVDMASHASAVAHVRHPEHTHQLTRTDNSLARGTSASCDVRGCERTAVISYRCELCDYDACTTCCQSLVDIKVNQRPSWRTTALQEWATSTGENVDVVGNVSEEWSFIADAALCKVLAQLPAGAEPGAVLCDLRKYVSFIFPRSLSVSAFLSNSVPVLTAMRLYPSLHATPQVSIAPGRAHWCTPSASTAFAAVLRIGRRGCAFGSVWSVRDPNHLGDQIAAKPRVAIAQKGVRREGSQRCPQLWRFSHSTFVRNQPCPCAVGSAVCFGWLGLDRLSDLHRTQVQRGHYTR
jgi:hypothetical protein